MPKTPTKNSIPQISEQKVKIIIRMRPILESQNSHQFVYLHDDNTLEIRRPGNFIRMKFNNILPPDSTQKDVFCLLEDSIKQFLRGTNVTIFSYGQTGTGKTYSIMGKFSPNQQYENIFDFLSSRQRGVLSRSLQMVMKLISEKKSSKLLVSFFQIYNQKIYDLYNFTLKPLQIRQCKNGEVFLPNLAKVEVSNINEVITFLITGFKNRATGETIKNAKSSRSHCIFQINLLSENENRQTFLSTLRIVDLAGSQKFKIPGDLSAQQKQIHTQELISINSSLSSLGFCISALTQKSRSHIPFRNSKLTRILTDSLLGNGLMRFIICISPSLSASNETFSTLQFANRAKKAVYNRNELSHEKNEKSISKQQSEQITRLKLQLSRERQIRVNLQHQLECIIDQFPQYLSRMQSKQDLSISHKNKPKYEDQVSREQSYDKHNYHKFFKQKNKDKSIKFQIKTPNKATKKSNQRMKSQSSSNFNKDIYNFSKSPNKSIQYIAFSQAASPNISNFIKNYKHEQNYNRYDTATILPSKNKSLNKTKNQGTNKYNQKRQKIRSFFIQSPNQIQRKIKSQYKIQQQQNAVLKQLKHQLNKQLKQKYSNITESPTFKQKQLQQLSNYQINSVLPSDSRTQQNLVQVYSRDSDPNILMPYRKQSLIFLREIDNTKNPISYSRSSSYSNSSFDQLNEILKQSGHNVSRRDRIINLFR